MCASIERSATWEYTQVAHRVSSSPCVICCGSENLSVNCLVHRLSASGHCVADKLREWEKSRSMLRPTLNFGVNFEEREKDLQVCTTCLELIVAIDRLEVDLEERFVALSALVKNRTDISPQYFCSVEKLCVPKEEPPDDEDFAARIATSDRALLPAGSTSSDPLSVDAEQSPLNASDTVRSESSDDDVDDGDLAYGNFGGSYESDEGDDEDYKAKPVKRLRRLGASKGSATKKTRGRRLKSDVSTGEERQPNEEETVREKKKRKESCPRAAKQKRDAAELVCKLCSEQFRSLKALKTHEMDLHDIARPYSCPHCDKTFARDSAFTRHVKEMHLNQPRAKVKCPHCPKVFTRWNVVRKHANRVHGEEPSIPCKKCGRKFVTTADRRLHMTHCDGTGNVPPELESEHAVCPICGEVKKGANAQYRLTVHIDGVHRKIKKHKCQLCPEAYEHYSSLLRHEALVHNVRSDRFQFPCDACGKILQTKHDLQLHKFSKHQVLEKGLKVLTCHHCGKQFLKKQALDQHIRSHEGIKPHACPTCEYRAVSFASLKNHMRSSHGRNVRRVFADGCKEETVYTIVDVEKGDEVNYSEEENSVE